MTLHLRLNELSAVKLTSLQSHVKAFHCEIVTQILLQFTELVRPIQKALLVQV